MPNPIVHFCDPAEAEQLNPDRCCRLCTRPGDFGRIDPAAPHSGLCPACRAAARPTRAGLERAVVLVAGQTLAAAEALPLSRATPEELTFHLCSLKRSLTSVLQLLEPAEAVIP
ncbi:hypothetical protein [Streptomyces litchfieldiae]|uniref:Uncharacterized protein n=1 Tax=Streptomyces litchfieldiae TaxID=3075543 RepID=A0ABU2MNM1_9ACTN|nr:hypothetical protein [Streptomyces sp. DSM 44938]MDT0343217.1 hypothetical protein [Streptomyces sp. DSM 44938]